MTANTLCRSESDRLPIRTKLLFGCGQGVEVSATFVANTFLLFYLTSVAGVSPAVAGTIIFLSLVVDAIADPFIGSWSDRTQSRWGRRLPFMVVGLPVICVASVALFSMPLTGSTGSTVVLALLLNILLRVGTSLYALPYAALTAELTSDYDERSSVTAYRMIFGFLGTVVTIAPAFGIIFATKEAYASRDAYLQLGGLLSAVVLVMGLICILGVRRAVLASPAEHLPPAATAKSFLGDLRDLLKNGSFIRLFMASLTALIIGGSMNALNLYAYSYFWKLPASLNQAPLLGFQVGLLLGIPTTALLLKRFEKRDVVIGGVALISLCQALSVLLAYAFFGDMPNLTATTILVIASAIFGGCNSLFFIAFSSMIADAVDEHEARFGQRCEGLYFSSLVFAAKAAVGIGSLIAGLVLTAVGLTTAGGASARIPAESATLLGLLWGAGHGAAFLLVLPFLAGHRLTRTRHQQLLQSLKHLRAARAT
ncbi:major facilitator superfamily MFS_1 [Sphingobium chlorophenolicum L-1]|uniref:Major facilitator superfamily MFS_1 n=1 Tax=Sphingobium chlorophenolicum L-1 TaxID=690566 RepID=F6EZP5_SPHCR|nr:MFS transporter [Sphingobium chlorophenolicum]AEG50229.1 major facilitator superfamily MFS_1 [Sphingobium chlorophenolicum L-1]